MTNSLRLDAVAVLCSLVLCATAIADPVPVPLNLTASFNADAWCGPLEYQECEGLSQDLVEVFGSITAGNGVNVVSSSLFLAADTTAAGMTYSREGDWYHPQYLSGTQGTPLNGILVGGDLRIYHIASAGGNGTMVGDWTEAADVTTHTVKPNCAVIGSLHNKASWQIAELTLDLPEAQRVKYTDVNFILNAMDMADRARNMEIYAEYTDGTSVLLYAFSTEDGGSGPKMTENAGGTDFRIVYTATKAYSSPSGTTGAIITSSVSFYEFNTPIALDSTRDLKGFRLRDSNPSLNWNARGLAVFAATARPLVDTGVNTLPVAVAGADQLVVDNDWTGAETVHLDGSASYDADGAVVAYAWTEGAATLATSAAADISLPIGLHTITLTVTDNAGGTAQDTLVINVSEAPSGTFYVDQATGSDSYPGTEALPFATINKATTTVGPGDTVIVKAGIYRESPTLTNNGQDGKPITLKAAPGERVIVSGADRLTGWQVCTPEIAKGNPNYANVYYVDIAFKPDRLVQDEFDLEKSRLPDTGWYICEGGTTTTLVDSVHLTQGDDYWNNAEIFVWDTSITAQYPKTITDFDAATHTITVDSVWNGTVVPEAGKDRYYLLNKVELINAPGEWAVEPLDGGTYRVYLWARDGGNPDTRMIEASRPGSFVINLGTRSYWVIDGLEIRHGQGHGIGTWSSGGLGHNTIQNCCIHHNRGMGIYGRFNDYSVYRRNYVVLNDGGITSAGSSHVLIEENEVGWNDYDGVLPTGPGADAEGNPLWWADGVTLRHNYIHDHYKWGHPDNAQSYNFVSNLTVEDNLFLHAVQSFMMEETEDTLYRNNVIIGAAAYSIILGHGNTYNTTFEHNTLMFSGYGLVAHSGWGYHYTDNLVIEGHSGTVWGGVGDGIAHPGDCTDYTSDYNVFWHGPGITGPVVVWNYQFNLTWAKYVQQSGRDTHSYYQDPLLTNVPSYFTMLDGSKQHLFTATRVYVPSSYIGLFAVGDHIEINWDGTMRTVTAVNTSSYYIEFTPGDEAFALKADQVANWKTKTDYEFNLTPLPGSPVIGNASDGGNIGSDIDVVAMMAGDYTGDGIRDIPVWPYQATSFPTLTITATLDYDWVYPNTPTTTAGRHKCLLTVSITSGSVDGQSYTVTVTENGAAPINFQIAQGAAVVAGTPTVIDVLGGQRVTSTAGTYTLNVTVTGSPGGQTATVDVPLSLRLLGDITGDGIVNASDKLEINKKLNGLATLPGIELRHLDLSGDGALVNAEDKLAINQVLNGLIVP